MHAAPQGSTRLPDLDERPLLVFWESTRACLLACRHCRAEALPQPQPGELTTEEARQLVEDLAAFPRPAPVLVVTGGDALMRSDLAELVALARRLAIPVALSPSVTPLFSAERLAPLKALGVKLVSVSLDGATASTHERIRGVSGHFEDTLEAIALLRRLGFAVQVNTLVARENVEELAAVAEIVHAAGAGAWELFFLVRVGRGTAVEELSRDENEDVCHFLYDASRYGFAVRTVEAPFFRRVVTWRAAGQPHPAGPLYSRLSASLRDRLGEPTSRPRVRIRGTRDGKGVVFVSHTGDIFPAGFLPLQLGNVKDDDIAAVYRDHPLLGTIRTAGFNGRCGICEYADVCGGSRARAFASSGDPLGEDPACAYTPERARVSFARQGRA